MFIILPILFFASLTLLLYHEQEFTGHSLRVSFLSSATITGSLILLSTEILSLLSLINFTALFLFWLTLSSLSCAKLYLTWHSEKIPFNLGGYFDWRKYGLSEKFIIVALIIIVIVLGITAFVCPPNTYDSMTYHMSRVFHWMQNGNVKYYPTNSIRELWMNPFAEYAILHLQVLSGSDRWANFIQFFSMIGCLLGISLIAKIFNASRKSQLLSILFAATIPMGILQASGTQNNYVASLWLICLVYFLFRSYETNNNIFIALSAVSLGLGILTKGSVYLFAAPFVLIFFFFQIKKYGKRSIKAALIILLCFSAINAGYYLRNYSLGGNIITPTNDAKILTNKHYSVSSLSSNLIRNIALHLKTPFKSINKGIEKGVISFHDLIKISPTDPRTTFFEMEFRLPEVDYHEDHSGNTFHFLLILAASSFIVFSRSLRKDKKFMTYLTCVWLGFILLSTCTKWQPWHSRLHTPFFVLLSPIFGIAVFDAVKNKKGAVILSILLIIIALPYLFFNRSKPILGQNSIFKVPRQHQYFTNWPRLAKPFIAISKYASEQNFKDIGIFRGGDTWEYPLDIIISPSFDENIRIEDINVDNESQKYMDNSQSDFSPELIIWEGCKDNVKMFRGNKYIRTRFFPPYAILVKDYNGRTAKSNLIYHIDRILKFMSITTYKIDKNKLKVVSLERTQATLTNLSLELLEAKLIDVSLINEIIPGAGDLTKNNLIKGLKMRLKGFAELKIDEYKEGQKLIFEWIRWFLDNKQLLLNKLQ